MRCCLKLRTMGAQQLYQCLVAIERRQGAGALAIGVELVWLSAEAHQVLCKLPVSVARRIMEAGISSSIDRAGVSPALHQEPHGGGVACAQRVAQRCDVPCIVSIHMLAFLQELDDSLAMAVPRSLVHRERRFLHSLEGCFQLRRHAAHAITDLEQQLLVIPVLHGSRDSVLLDLVEDVAELWVTLQAVELFPCFRALTLEFCLIVLSDGLCLEPTSHGLWVLREVLQASCDLRVPLKVPLHLIPGALVNLR
mmetsp:Transcript_11054/g.25975  ORF Transcript_11054/g.25975 Transcript_11054/m.25975 type:complete len:252 (-) Transcript_11054:113-868(-)